MDQIKTCPDFDPMTHRAVDGVFDEEPDGAGGIQLVQRIEALAADEITARVGAAVQRHLDATVQARGYESIHTCVTYADEPAVPRFQAEGQAARAWRSAVWACCYAALDAVLAGQREPLTPSQMVAELPLLIWPRD